ncbi:MAG: thiamine diphosphokinase [Anaerovoracaceae bacterium]
MKKCILITSYLEGKIKDLIDVDADDYIICADGGYDLAVAEGITPSIVIGDFDSARLPVSPGLKTLTVPAKKDLTDTALCIDHAVEQGFTNLIIVGGIGGRLDHTIANIQNVFSSMEKGISALMVDAKNIVMALINTSTILPAKPGYKLSLFSFSQVCRGVTASGVAYPLQDHTLNAHFPLGVSNEITQEEAFIQVTDGELLVILSKD